MILCLNQVESDLMHGASELQGVLEQDDLGAKYRGIGSRLTHLLRQRTRDVQRNATQAGRDADNKMSLPDSCIEDPNYSAANAEGPGLNDINALELLLPRADLLESVIRAAAARLGKVSRKTHKKSHNRLTGSTHRLVDCSRAGWVRNALE